MSVTYSEGLNVARRLFWNAWRARTPGVNGGKVPEVRWPGVTKDTSPPTTEAWARFTIRHGRDGQRTLGSTGNRRFGRSGIITIQVFTPLVAGGGLSLAENLAIIARDAYEGVGTPEGVWFRNVRITEVGDEGAWHQDNVIAEFEYDEIK